MPNPMIAVAGATVASTASQASAARRAAGAQESAARRGISEQQAAREAFEQRTEPFRQIGLAAATPILDLLGIAPPQGLLTGPGQAGAQGDISALQGQIANIDQQVANLPAAIPGRPDVSEGQRQELLSQRAGLENQLNTIQAQQQAQQEIAGQQTQVAPTGQPSDLLGQVNPLVSFLRQEGFEDIQEQAAAQGRLRSGGTLQDLTRFNTQLASTVVPQLQQQRFNQLFNLLGLGSNVAAGQGTAQLQTASNIGNLLGNVGQAQAAGALGQGQAIQSGISGLAGIFGAQQGGLFGAAPQQQPLGGQALGGAIGGLSSGTTLGGF